MTDSERLPSQILDLVEQAADAIRKPSSELKTKIRDFRSTLSGLRDDEIRRYDETLEGYISRRPPTMEIASKNPLYYVVLNCLPLWLSLIHGTRRFELRSIAQAQQVRSGDQPKADLAFVEQDLLPILVRPPLWSRVDIALHRELLEMTAAWLEGARADNRLERMRRVDEAKRLPDGQVMMDVIRLHDQGSSAFSVSDSIVQRLKSDGYFNSRRGVMPEACIDIYRSCNLLSTQWPTWLRLVTLWLGSWTRAHLQRTYLGHRRRTRMSGTLYWLVILMLPLTLAWGIYVHYRNNYATLKRGLSDSAEHVRRTKGQNVRPLPATDEGRAAIEQRP